MSRVHACIALIALSCSTAVLAQEPPSLRPHRFTVAAGSTWQGTYGIGEGSADLRGNGTGATPPPFTLFTASGSFEEAFGLEARVGFTLSRAWAIEVAGGYERPRLPVSIGDDREAGSVSLDGERISQYRVEASLLWQIPIGLGPRTRVYLLGGGGYLRQLHENRTLVQTGQVYHGGAGARVWLRGGEGLGRAAGLRGEIRVVTRRDGIDFSGDTRTYPAAHALAFFVF